MGDHGHSLGLVNLGPADGVAFTTRPFRPAPGVSGPHAQTLLARVLRSTDGPVMKRERWSTDDGDFLDLDWGPDPSDGAPLALILHGLEGSSRRSYVRSLARMLLGVGVRPIAMNFRGCSGEPNRALRFYHSGETTDVSWVLHRLRSRFPDRPLGAAGFSLGGNVLLKLMGERADGGSKLLDAAVAISVPYDLDAGCALLERSRAGRMYSAYFLRSLRRKVRAKAERLADVVDLPAALAAPSIRAFDDAVTAPLNGFGDAADYYARCSSHRFLRSVRVPTLLLHAEDDPFLPSSAIPVREAEDNPRLDLPLQPRGGHVGFLSGSLLRPDFWADGEAARYLASRLRSADPGPA